MSHALTALLALVAFALLALAMDRHQRELFGRKLAAVPARALRAAGWATLAASLANAVSAQGWSLGLVAWCGHISLGSGLVILALVFNERRRA